MELLRPRVCQDITPKRGRVFRAVPRRVNLSFRGTRYLPLVRAAQAAAAAAALASFFFGSAAAPTLATHAATATSTDASVERQALEAQLQTLEGQINQYEDQVTGYQKQGHTLKNEISILNSNIARLNLQIQAITLTIKQLDQKISDTKFQIQTTESSIQSRKDALTVLIRNLQVDDQVSLIEVFLKNPHLSDFFGDINNLLALQNNVRVTIDQITALRDQLNDEQNQFLVARADAASASAYREAQKQEISSTRSQKNQLLAVTKGQESKYQSLLTQTKETAAKIRNRIFELLGGGELSFEQAYEYAKLASGATGVRPSLILAVLDRESALGQNVGRCGYKAAMSPSNQTIFLQLASDLGLNPDVMTVSCPNRDGVYGGAMGPAQFVPSTWNLYKDQVAKATGHNPPSPWNNADAFVATALYLRDAGGATDSISAERAAAAKYYAGSNWRRYLWTYGEAVVSRAQQFEDDITTITG